MCYSVRAEQNAKKLARMLGAQVDIKRYDELFSNRLSGEKLFIRKGIEESFLIDAESTEEQEILSKIENWHANQITQKQQELFKQTKRLADAERKLKEKTTKSAEENKRIATGKIQKLKDEIKAHENLEEFRDTDFQVFPFHYISMLHLNEKKEKVIAPFRYHMRPHNKSVEFDKTNDGCYNARFDNLKRVEFWKDSLGKRHGVIVIKKFYENVAAIDYLKKNELPRDVYLKENIILKFEPKGVEYMFIPTLWDAWQKNDGSFLWSAALITDDPPLEVLETGHDRCPIFLDERFIDEWLHSNQSAALDVLMKRKRPFYEHQIQKAA